MFKFIAKSSNKRIFYTFSKFFLLNSHIFRKKTIKLTKRPKYFLNKYLGRFF